MKRKEQSQNSFVKISILYFTVRYKFGYISTVSLSFLHCVFSYNNAIGSG